MKARILLVAAVLLSCSGCASEQRAREQERFDQAMTALEQANSLNDFFEIQTNTFNMRVGDRFEEVPNPDLIAQKRRQWYISKHPDLSEGMKQIILEDPETRINTLRHVFGIDKYKTILENVSILATKLREEKRMKEGMTANLEQNKSNLVTKQNELIIKQQNIFPLENELLEKREARKRIQEEK